MLTQTATDPISLIMGVGSTVLAVLSLVLSILFYRWADKEAKASQSALVEVRSAIATLDRLLAGVREESFSLLRSAYTDMGEIAKIGARRDGAEGPVVTSPPVPDRAARSTGPGSPRRLQEEEIRDRVPETLRVLGERMMQRRGVDFPAAFKEAERRINEIFDASPANVIITAGEFAQKLEPFGFDLGEVAYVLEAMKAAKTVRGHGSAGSGGTTKSSAN
jgi:hypothetical protein